MGRKTRNTIICQHLQHVQLMRDISKRLVGINCTSYVVTVYQRVKLF